MSKAITVTHYARKRYRGRGAFTLVELLIAVTVLGAVAAMVMPNLNRTVRQRRVIAAASALSSDVEAAFSLAARQRRPVRLTFDAGSGEIRVADRASGTVHRRRPLQSSSEYRLDAVSLSVPVVDVFPNGVASAGFSVSLTSGPFQRQVVVTRTGLTKVLVP